MVTITKIEQGVAAYLDSELMPKLPETGLEKILAGTAISLVIRRGGKILDSYRNNKTVQLLGIMDAEGNVDIDVLAEELKKNMPADGVKIDVPMIGAMTFHKSDIDKLYSYIKAE